MIAPDVKRARTFLSAKGFQWEPIENSDGMAASSRDFHACQEGDAFFTGTVISIGKEQPWDGGPLTVVDDPEQKDKLRLELTHQLNSSVQRLEAADSSNLPKVAIIANHEPLMAFEDLTGIIDTVTNGELLTIQSFIWFDDFRSDKMIFCRDDTPLYKMMGAAE